MTAREEFEAWVQSIGLRMRPLAAYSKDGRIWAYLNRTREWVELVGPRLEYPYLRAGETVEVMKPARYRGTTTP